MNKKRLLAGVLALFLTGGVAAWAADDLEPLYDWPWEGFAGQQTNWAETGDDTPTWNDALGSSETTGDGTLRIQRAVGETHTVWVTNEHADEPVLWLIVDFAGWAFSMNEGSTDEDFRLGFQNEQADATQSLQQYAMIALSRPGFGDEAHLHGRAELVTEEASWIDHIPTGLSNEEDRPVRVVLKVDQEENQYSIFYNVDGEGYVRIGAGDLQDDRSPNYIRFTALNSFADAMDPDDPDAGTEFVDIDRIALTDTDPIGDAYTDFPEFDPMEENLRADWHFDDPEGTPLSEAENAVSDVQWNADIGGSATTGDGAFRIEREPQTQLNALAFIEPVWGAGKQWVVADIRGWYFDPDPDQSVPSETFQAGFFDNTSATTTAQFRLRRFTPTATGAPDDPQPEEVYVGGRAFGFAGSSTLPEGDVAFSHERDEPLRLVVEYDHLENTYAIYYRDGLDGEYELYGEGPTSRWRRGNLLDVRAVNNFGEPGQFFDVDRIFYTTQNPMVEAELPDAARLVALGRNAAGNFEIRVEGDANTSYVVEATSDLGEGDWQVLGLAETGGEGFDDVEDPDSADEERRFYRVQPE